MPAAIFYQKTAEFKLIKEAIKTNLTIIEMWKITVHVNIRSFSFFLFF